MPPSSGRGGNARFSPTKPIPTAIFCRSELEPTGHHLDGQLAPSTVLEIPVSEHAPIGHHLDGGCVIRPTRRRPLNRSKTVVTTTLRPPKNSRRYSVQFIDAPKPRKRTVHSQASSSAAALGEGGPYKNEKGSETNERSTLTPKRPTRKTDSATLSLPPTVRRVGAVRNEP
jgi:hypothetical protein